jgi:hypothetical protein
LQNCQLAIQPEREVLWSVHDVTPGTIFMRGGVIVEVVTITENSVVIREETTLNQVSISHNEARNLIEQFLTGDISN